MSHSYRSLSWIILHSAVIVLTLLSLFTGLRIAAVTRPEVLSISILLPQGYLHGIHLASAAGLTAIVIAYLYLHRFEVVKKFRHGFFHHRVTQYGYLVILVLLLSGGLLYFGSTVNMQDVHYYAALAFVFYLLLHAVIMFVQYGTRIFFRMVRFSKIKPFDAKVLSVITATLLLIIFFIQPFADKTLHIHRIELSEFIEIDGLANEEIWNKAKPITIPTHGGANFVDGMTPVTLRALHNNVEAFFHISWLDPTKSLKHLPLVKTETAWRVLEDGFYRFDEQTHYEDKLAIMLANTCESGGAKTTHLGPKPLKNKPANWHGKGFHYSSDGKVRDIWHWKAVRTNDMYLADDNFFAAPDVLREGQSRYTAGYLPDGKESGAYVMNWQWYSPKGVLPKRLPSDAALLKPYQRSDNNNADWVVPWYDYVLYDAAKDNYAKGTIMPSILYVSNRFEGDRADVRARGQWHEGRWSLELVRPLNTGSANDIVMANGVCLWVSAFDHSQIAHTRHIRPARLFFEGL